MPLDAICLFAPGRRFLKSESTASESNSRPGATRSFAPSAVSGRVTALC